MLRIENQLASASQRRDEQLTFSLRCGIAGLVPPLNDALAGLGLRPDPTAHILLLIDLPCGFVLRTLQTARWTNERVVVMTENSCPDYWEDLWALQPAGLVVGIQFDRAFIDTLVRVARGERLRLTPDRPSPLTINERALLRTVACGWDNARIARQFHVEDKTVRNALTRVYTKLGVANRVEATLYYWGRLDLCTSARW